MNLTLKHFSKLCALLCGALSLSSFASEQTSSVQFNFKAKISPPTCSFSHAIATKGGAIQTQRVHFDYQKLQLPQTKSNTALKLGLEEKDAELGIQCEAPVAIALFAKDDFSPTKQSSIPDGSFAVINNKNQLVGHWWLGLSNPRYSDEDEQMQPARFGVSFGGQNRSDDSGRTILPADNLLLSWLSNGQMVIGKRYTFNVHISPFLYPNAFPLQEESIFNAGATIHIKYL
ncbi:hypothetical protein [Chromobacterium sinusclupearum]|jgi:hypothetical protein|uniref:hypothetical protein n=1 Tax=Chromobacterium sinusclupearum TaxID=2077146 RepID=UPI0011AF4893|nr:hypothetical protein [Chromobacterium sinusclupearum]